MPENVSEMVDKLTQSRYQINNTLNSTVSENGWLYEVYQVKEWEMDHLYVARYRQPIKTLRLKKIVRITTDVTNKN